MRRVLLTIVAVCTLMPAALMAQETKIGVVDMERAVVQSAAGKKAEVAFNAKFDELRKVIEAKQKGIDDAQNKLKTQDRLLSDSAKADLTRGITRDQTDMTRLQEDSQKELDSLRADLMKPIAEVAEAIVNAYAQQKGFTLIVDTSNPQNESIVFVLDRADITNDVIKLIDSEMAKAAPPAAPKAPAAPAPAKKP